MCYNPSAFPPGNPCTPVRRTEVAFVVATGNFNDFFKILERRNRTCRVSGILRRITTDGHFGITTERNMDLSTERDNVGGHRRMFHQENSGQSDLEFFTLTRCARCADVIQIPSANEKCKECRCNTNTSAFFAKTPCTPVPANDGCFQSCTLYF